MYMYIRKTISLLRAMGEKREERQAATGTPSVLTQPQRKMRRSSSEGRRSQKQVKDERMIPLSLSLSQPSFPPPISAEVDTDDRRGRDGGREGWRRQEPVRVDTGEGGRGSAETRRGFPVRRCCCYTASDCGPEGWGWGVLMGGGGCLGG